MSQVRHERGGWYSAVRRSMVVPLTSSTLGMELFSSTSHNLGAHQGAQVAGFFRHGRLLMLSVFAHGVKWEPVPRLLAGLAGPEEDPDLPALILEPGAAHLNTSGFSRFGGRRPVRPATQFSADLLAILSRVSIEALPM